MTMISLFVCWLFKDFRFALDDRRHVTRSHSWENFKTFPTQVWIGSTRSRSWCLDWPPPNPRPGAGSHDGPASWLAEAACPGLSLAAAAPQQTPLCPGAGLRLPGWLGIRKETQLSPEWSQRQPGDCISVITRPTCSTLRKFFYDLANINVGLISSVSMWHEKIPSKLTIVFQYLWLKTHWHWRKCTKYGLNVLCFLCRAYIVFSWCLFVIREQFLSSQVPPSPAVAGARRKLPAW